MPQIVIYGLPIGPYRFKLLWCAIIFALNSSFADIVNIVEIGWFDPIFQTSKLLDIVYLNITLLSTQIQLSKVLSKLVS